MYRIFAEEQLTPKSMQQYKTMQNSSKPKDPATPQVLQGGAPHGHKKNSTFINHNSHSNANS